jgi:hypothetical protein
MPGKSKAQIAKENRDRNKKVSSSTNAQARVGKSKAQFVKEQREKNLEKRKRANMKKSVGRPQQKQKPKKKSIITKIKDKLFSKGKAAKAAEIIRKDKPKKETSREANARAAGVTGKMPRAKDSQVMKAEKDRRARAKAKAAKKASFQKAADNRDAKRGGFISANAMKSSAKKANKAQADRKKKKSDELISRGRR